MDPKSTDYQEINNSKIDDTISETLDKALSQWTRLPFKVKYSQPPFSFKKTKDTAEKE